MSTLRCSYCKKKITAHIPVDPKRPLNFCKPQCYVDFTNTMLKARGWAPLTEEEVRAALQDGAARVIIDSGGGNGN